jgi:hypothetical protein
MATPLAISFGQMFDDTGQFAGGHAAVLPQAATVMLIVPCMVTLALAIAALSFAARESATLPRWHTWVSALCAVALVFSVFFMPLFALPVWSAATVVALWRTPKVAPA